MKHFASWELEHEVLIIKGLYNLKLFLALGSQMLTSGCAFFTRYNINDALQKH